MTEKQATPAAPIITARKEEGMDLKEILKHEGLDIDEEVAAGLIRAVYKRVLPELQTISADIDPTDVLIYRGFNACRKETRQNLAALGIGVEQMTAKDQKCWWEYDEFENSWHTTCGNAWCFEDGGVKENGVNFCPFCGLSVAIVKEKKR